jgi:FkbM family methyltransferase
MYLIKTESYNTEDPVYSRITGSPNSFFVPVARVAKDYFNTGYYERGIVSWALDNFADEKRDMIDIGAHIGFYTTAFARRSRLVHSFECSPKSYNYLCANIALQDLHYKVKTYPFALSDKEGTTKYYIRDAGDGGGNGISVQNKDIETNVPTVDVPTRTLDSFGITNVRFMKIDVEGHEEFVLRGAKNTIMENDYPKILFESWPPRYETFGIPATEIRKSLFEYLQSLEYKVVQLAQDDMCLAERQ